MSSLHKSELNPITADEVHASDAIIAALGGDTHARDVAISKASITAAVQTAITCQCKTGCRRVLDVRTASLFSFGENASQGMIAICGACSPRWIAFSRDLSRDRGIDTTVETWLGVEHITQTAPVITGEQLDLFNN